MAKIGKRLRKASENLDLTLLLSLKEAISTVKSRATAKFDESIGDISIEFSISIVDSLKEGSVSISRFVDETFSLV